MTSEFDKCTPLSSFQNGQTCSSRLHCHSKRTCTSHESFKTKLYLEAYYKHHLHVYGIPITRTLQIVA
jgi:hypothetical protein